MFGQLKDMYALQKQAREMKKQMEAEQVTGSSSDGQIHLTLNGSYDLTGIKVEEAAQLSPAEIEKGIREAYQDANSQLKSMLMEKFKGMM